MRLQEDTRVAADASRAQLADASQVGRRVWLQATVAAAGVATVLDAALLEQKKSFFTGGFLTAIHASTIAEATVFLLTSFLVDASLLGLFALAVLWATSGLRLTRHARLVMVAGGALTPLVIWSFISYSLLSYLGDAFDIDLMFDLTGRNPGEILAVSSSHLGLPTLLATVAISSLGVVVWAVNWLGARARRATVHVPWRLAIVAVGLFVTGFVLAGLSAATSDVLEDGLRRKGVGNTYTRLTAAITDFDGDGYGIGGRISDPAPFNSAIYPYALDIPGNGIDENGVGGDLPSAEPAYVERTAATTPWAHRPNVVLIVLESFRADVVGRELNGRPVTPVLDGLAREGVSSAQAYSHNGYTVQSRYHLFTGSLAGLRQDGSILDDFKRNGYETAYFSGQDESFGGPAAGVGFERADVSYDARQDRDRRYSTFTTAGSLAVSHRTVQERLEEFLASRDASRPLFLYLNFHDTHFPYHHRDIESLISEVAIAQRQITPSRREALFEMYLNTAANVDRAIGTALEAVTRAVGGPPAVVVTADHGESLFDEGFLGHGYALNEVQTRIPLIVRGLPMEIGEPFGQVDLRDALLDALARDDGEARPRIVRSAGRTVFQYLGNIHKPRQIAFHDGAARVIYDFRNNRVTLADRAPVHPDTLEGSAAEPFLALVHYWERMMLARAARAAPAIE
jgi:arylsulfatase A-like enzyme